VVAMAGDAQDIMAQFYTAVNMSPARLDDWLKTPESQSVGQMSAPEDPDSESIGYASGRRILALLRKDRQDLTTEDFHDMQHVVSYVHRHLAQRPQPDDDMTHSRWRYSLMNWGHDPLVDDTFVGTHDSNED
jgi:hypothetical protein